MKAKEQYTYNQVSYILTMISLAALWLASTWSMENEIDNLKLDLQQQTDSLNTTIDSLMLEIDTLTWENEIWDHNTNYNERCSWMFTNKTMYGR